MNTHKIFLSVAVLSFVLGGAQQSKYFSDKENYRWGLAENLYQTKIYSASQYEYARQYFFSSHLSHSRQEASQFFDAIVGVILQKNYAEKGLEAFMRDYPQSAYFAKASLPLADYYLTQKDFAKALETLEKVDGHQLSKEENTDYILKKGYAKFMMGDTKGAIRDLKQAHHQIDEEHRAEVAYMLGHLHYAEGDNKEAFQYFDSIKEDEKYVQLVRPYYVQLYFNEKNYDKAIAEGNELLGYDISDEYKAEVHKIIGESYFMKGDYEQAYPHLRLYLNTQQSPTENDLYEMGFVCSQLQKYEEAVSYYNQLIHSSSAMAQNAYYQLGNAYLQTGRKQEALSAFRSAFQMDYDLKVQQLANEQYAKLSYDIGNPFESAPAVIQGYIQKYPKSPKVVEMKSLLVKSYLYSGNYRETLEAIDKLPNSTSETDKIDQEVSFLLGTEEFNKGNFDEAEKYFLRSLETHQNKEITPRATYWLAQTYYNKANYPSAIERYERILKEDFPERQQLPYDLAYAYFKAKKFDKAKQYFKEYLKNPKPEFKSDAELRLADTFYADNELNEAIAIYDKTEASEDYTFFQKAMALGFKGDTQAKINSLKTLITKHPNSEYTDDALYELGTAYASQDDFIHSNEYFSRVIKSSSDKDLIANAQIYKAQNLISQGQDEKALNELRTLGSQYKNSAYASKIVQAARPVFIKKGDVAGYETFASSLGVGVESSDIDEINLSTARSLYAKKDYKNAIIHYEKYLSKNPAGEGLYQAQYELGESLYQTKNTNKALAVLHQVAEVQNDYQEDAQTRIAQIYLSQNKTNEAKQYLEVLSQSANTNIKTFASVELMKLFAAQGDFKQAEKYADIVISTPNNSISTLEIAKVIKARSLMNSGRDKEAQKAYASLEKSLNTEVAAEALYVKAFYQNKAKAYKSSNETVFKLANNYSSEEYWGAKALLVMARNYIGLKDKYQASYTVDQLIENYTDYPDIISEAKEIKKLIK